VVDDTAEAVRCAKKVADTLPTTVKGGGPSRTQTAAGISAMLNLANTEPEAAPAPDALDADPYLLNVANGTLDLRTGQLRDHDPANLLTKICGAAYRPGAAAPRFGCVPRRDPAQPGDAGLPRPPVWARPARQAR
jgi:putative DNA primase/helicase